MTISRWRQWSCWWVFLKLSCLHVDPHACSLWPPRRVSIIMQKHLMLPVYNEKRTCCYMDVLVKRIRITVLANRGHLNNERSTSIQIPWSSVVREKTHIGKCTHHYRCIRIRHRRMKKKKYIRNIVGIRPLLSRNHAVHKQFWVRLSAMQRH